MRRPLIRLSGFALIAALASGVALFAVGSSGSGSISITPSNTYGPENFSTLSSTTTPSNALPSGWYLTELNTGGAADGLYVVGTGSSNSGGAYSFGVSGSTERALGSLGSGTVTPIHYGARFVNNTGAVITSVTVSYAGEMWRRGTATATSGEGLTFAYSTDATSLTTGTFTTVPALAFASPGASCGPDNSATVGNSANCRRDISGTFSGLVIPDGREFWIRWTDTDTGGSDDAVAIDDVSLSVTTSTLSIPPTATGAALPSPVSPGGSVTLSGSITPGQNPTSASFNVSCDLTALGGAATAPLSVTGTTFTGTFPVPAATSPGVYPLACAVTDDQARSGSFSINTTVLIPLNTTCGAPATPVHSVQGSGALSPLAGQIVDLEGIVVGPFQGASGLSGFYLEEASATQDSDVATSEGIFVFANVPAVTVGDRIRIRGTVTEFASSTPPLTSNLTELGTTSNATVCSTGNALPPAAVVTLPLASATDWERYEGMLVEIATPLVVTGNFNLGIFGQIDLAPSVLYQPTNAAGNTATWTAQADLNARSRIALDDASNSANATLNGGGLAPYPSPGLTATNTLRVGATVNPGGTSLTGVLDDRFGSYRIQPTAPVTFSNTPNPRPATSAVTTALGGRFRAGSANVLNFFTTLGSRGAATPTELVNQRTKVIAALAALNADVIGLSEVQNFVSGGTSGGTYTNSAAADLASSLATATGRSYQFIDTIDPAKVVGGDITQNGTDAIRNVILYDASRLTPVGLAALYYQNDTNRPSLAQTFKPATGFKADQQTFTFVVNHFRSKGSACGGASDDPLQGNCNGLRTLMANNVQSWLDTNPTGDPAGANRKYLLVGDFNAYFGEDPIQAFISGGVYTNLINKLVGADAYSYNFGSQAGYLDHALVNKALLPLVKGVAELHINADEPSSLQALDSNIKSAPAQAAYFAPNEFAASDHDPFVVAFNPLSGDLDDDGDVDLVDRTLISTKVGKPVSEVDRRMDFDGDGLITANDYRLWNVAYRAYIQ